MWREGTRCYGALSSGIALMQDPVQQRGRRGADVEAGDPPAHRQRHDLVARGGDTRPQALALAAHHEDDAAGVVRAGVLDRRLGGGAVAPAAGLLGLRRGSRRRCARGRSRRCSTAPAEALATAGVTSAARRSGITTPVAPAHLGRAADRAQVLRVLDLVEHNDERVVGGKSSPRVGVGVVAGAGADALVGVAAASARDLLGEATCTCADLAQPRLLRARAPWPRPRAPAGGRPAAPPGPGCARRGSRLRAHELGPGRPVADLPARRRAARRAGDRPRRSPWPRALPRAARAAARGGVSGPRRPRPRRAGSRARARRASRAGHRRPPAAPRGGWPRAPTPTPPPAPRAS